MPLPQVPPGDGGQRKRTHWHHPSTPNGAKWHAWIAGPCHWYRCHTKSKSQPCCEEMTGGKVYCERCDMRHDVETIGYQPLYRELDTRPVFVIVHEYVREVVDALKFHQRVIVGRGDEASDGIYVIPALNPLPKFESTLRERHEPADLTESLLKIWRLPALTEWYRKLDSAPTVPTAAPPAAPPVKSDGKPFSPMTKAAAQRYSAPDGALSEDIDVLRARMLDKMSGHTNGKPKPR